MIFTGVCTGNEGVQPFDAVRKPMFHQKIQRAISNRRLGREPAFSKYVEDVIGAKRTMFEKQDFEHFLTHRCQLQPCRVTMGSSRFNTAAHAMGMVMGLKTDHLGLICYIITHNNPE